MIQTFTIELDGKRLIFETGRMAKQADGAVTVQLGGTIVLVSCVYSKEPKEEVPDVTPFTVEYKERTYAAGKIPGGFFKREGRPTEKEILTARLIDRPIRPLFPKGLMNEIQIIAMVLSADGENDPDILAVNGASCALSMSEIPFSGPIGAVRVGLRDNKLILLPTFDDLDKGVLDLVVAGNEKGIIMLEAGANQVSEERFLDAIEFGYSKVLELIGFQKEQIVKSCGRTKVTLPLYKTNQEVLQKISELASSRIAEVYKLTQKEQREDALDMLSKELVDKFVKQDSEHLEQDVKSALVELERRIVRELILNQQKRVDGRTIREIRPITCEVGLLPRTHGSGLFTRGHTQSLSVVTLGTSADEQMIDALEGEEFKSFMLHYNFPPFSVGEVRPLRGPGRREIGHGALAERALKPLMPSKEEFPYTVRVVSDILESNGSSSMATVCGSTLALMDAGVPIKAPVAGIAIGLVKEDSRYVLLTDIGGVEDHFGDMDFKVAGTQKGITAIQMDLKIDGITLQMIKEVLGYAKEARLIVMEKMLKTISKPKDTISKYAPRIKAFKINPDRIRDLIGPGGKTIRKIIDETGVTIDIDNDGTVSVASSDEEALNKAIKIINELTEEVEVGKIYKAKVKKIADFGAFCEVLPGKEGLVHVSELSHRFVRHVEDEVKIGEEILVKVIGIDEFGRINLSRKQAIPKQEGLRTDEKNRSKGYKKAW